MAGGSCVSDRGREPLRFASVVIVGGGCYGSYYVQQLQRAAAAGALVVDQLLVVDRDPGCRVARDRAPSAALQPDVVVADWSTFLAAFLAERAARPAPGSDAIVPSPLMPHLLYQWLAARMRERWPTREVHGAPLEAGLDVPWQRAGEDGTHYASYATWMCPINCIEPARCPHTRGPRDWTMPVALERHVRGAAEAGREIAGPYVFHCTHRAYGVGMIDVAAVVAAEADLARRAAAGRVDALVGTVSHCHGAVSRLVVGSLTAGAASASHAPARGG